MKIEKPDKFPPGWDERRVREIIEHYDNQTDEEATAEDEAFRRRADELRRKNLSEEEIEEILAREADELCRAGEPSRVRSHVLAFELSPRWFAKARFFAEVHNFSDYRDWIKQIVEERLQLEDRLYQGLKKEAASGHKKKRRTARRLLSSHENHTMKPDSSRL